MGLSPPGAPYLATQVGRVPSANKHRGRGLGWVPWVARFRHGAQPREKQQGQYCDKDTSVLKGSMARVYNQETDVKIQE